MGFSKYGAGCEPIAFSVLLEMQRESQELWAHAEESGCEGCYCEVARWNHQTRRWERFAFEKFFGGECRQLPDAGCVETAQHYADQINNLGYLADRSPIIHSMPAAYGELSELEKAAAKLAEAFRKNPAQYAAFDFDPAFGAVVSAGRKLLPKPEQATAGK